MRSEQFTGVFSAMLMAALMLIPWDLGAQEQQKQRVIILTDVENEPDDTQSLIRLLLYSNLPEIKGIIATTSVHMKKEVHPESIRKAIRAYGMVQANLAKHEAGFPVADSLLLLVKQGLPEYGMNAVGDGRDSEGSDWIIKTLQSAILSFIFSIAPEAQSIVVSPGPGGTRGGTPLKKAEI